MIDGGGDEDFIVGGPGNDELRGGGENDVVFGNTTAVLPDRLETVTRGNTSGRNDDVAFAATLPGLASDHVANGTLIQGLSFHEDDTGDWYILRTPTARQAFGSAQLAFVSADMISVVDSQSTPIDEGSFNLFLFAAEDNNPSEGLDLTPVEQPVGVPEYYLLHVVNESSDDLEYNLHFSSDLGATIDVPAEADDVTIDSSFGGDRSAIIPLGDINGDTFDDFIALVDDDLGDVTLLENDDGTTHVADRIGPTFARIVFGSDTLSDQVVDANSVSLSLPAPVRGPSLFGSKSVFASPGDYNGDGLSDIAVAVSMDRLSHSIHTDRDFDAGGVYVLFGDDSPGAWTGVIDVQAAADVVISQPDVRLSVDNLGNINNDTHSTTGFPLDDLGIAVTDDFNGSHNGGATTVFFGREVWPASSTLAQSDVVLISPAAPVGPFFFQGVVGIGDFNGDGVDDFASFEQDSLATQAGVVHLIFGPVAPTNTTIASVADVTLTVDAVSLRIEDIRPAGNVNGDALPGGGPLDDILLVGTTATQLPLASSVLVTGRDGLSGSTPLASVIDVVTPDGDLFVPLGGDKLGVYGTELSSRLDESPNTRAHRVGRVLADNALANLFDNPALILESAAPNYSGGGVSFFVPPFIFGEVGDVDGDGAADFALGDELVGSVHVYRGKSLAAPAPPATEPELQDAERYQYELATPLSSGGPPSEPSGIDLTQVAGTVDIGSAFAVEGSATEQRLANVYEIGDINGDGFSELLFSDNSTFPDASSNFILLGPVEFSGLEEVTDLPHIEIDLESLGVLAPTFGDVNADGLTDLVFYNIGSTDTVFTVVFGTRRDRVASRPRYCLRVPIDDPHRDHCRVGDRLRRTIRHPYGDIGSPAESQRRRL